MQPLLLLPSCLAGICCSPAVCGGLMDWLGVRLSSCRVIWCGVLLVWCRHGFGVVMWYYVLWVVGGYDQLMGTTALQTLSEGRNTTDLVSIYMQEDLSWCEENTAMCFWTKRLRQTFVRLLIRKQKAIICQDWLEIKPLRIRRRKNGVVFAPGISLRSTVSSLPSVRTHHIDMSM